MAKVIHCPASNGYCEEEYYCENCQKYERCMQKKTQYHDRKRSSNGECFRCRHLKAVTMGVACGIKNDR